MILVLLGTFPTQFPRPLKEIDKLCREGYIKEEVIVQNGFTEFRSDHLIFRPFITPEELIKLYQEARIVISHAGSGSILKGLKLEKKVIAIPRLAKYGEVVDDHQEEILEEFEKEKFLLGWKEGDSLKDLLEKAKDFKPVKFQSKKQTIIDFLDSYLDSI